MLAHTPLETSVICAAPLLAALGPSNTQGACEVEVEASILEGAAAATAYAVWRELSTGAAGGDAGGAGGAAGAEPDLTARLTGGGADDVSTSMFFSESGLKLWYYAPPQLKA